MLDAAFYNATQQAATLLGLQPATNLTLAKASFRCAACYYGLGLRPLNGHNVVQHPTHLPHRSLRSLPHLKVGGKWGVKGGRQRSCRLPP